MIVKALAPNSGDLIPSLEPTWWEVRTPEVRVPPGQFRLLAAPGEGSGLVPSMHVIGHTVFCNSSTRGSDTLFQPLGTLHVCGAHIYGQAEHSLKINLK